MAYGIGLLIDCSLCLRLRRSHLSGTDYCARNVLKMLAHLAHDA